MHVAYYSGKIILSGKSPSNQNCRILNMDKMNYPNFRILDKSSRSHDWFEPNSLNNIMIHKLCKIILLIQAEDVHVYDLCSKPKKPTKKTK